RYSVTTFDPGARLVFTHGCRFRFCSTAFFATSPAPIMTDGLDVFVQLVIAAMTTEPSLSSICCPSTSQVAVCIGAATAIWLPPSDSQRLMDASVGAGTEPFGRTCSRAEKNDCLTSERRMRSCGRRGPASD